MITSAVGDAIASDRTLSSSRLRSEADFYAKFDRFETEVLTGRHPQYKLPEVDIERLASGLSAHCSPSWSSANTPATNGHPNVTTLQSIASQARRTHNAFPLPARPPVAQDTQGLLAQEHRPVTARNAPQFDPVLLTKSDHLVRAEETLKLQHEERILNTKRVREDELRKETLENEERALRDKLHCEERVVNTESQREEETLKERRQHDDRLLADNLQRERDLKNKRQTIEQALNGSVQTEKKQKEDHTLVPWFGPLTFSGNHVFDEALVLVKPVSGVQFDVAERNTTDVTEQNTNDSSSFDDGYYSSKGNSWSPENEIHSSNLQGSAVATLTQNNGDIPVIPDVHIEEAVVGTEARASGLGPQDVAMRIATPDVLDASFPHANISEVSGDDQDDQDDPMDTDDSREESYSPPAADVLGPGTALTGGLHQNNQSHFAPRNGQRPVAALDHHATMNAVTRMRDGDSESYSPPPAVTRVVPSGPKKMTGQKRKRGGASEPAVPKDAPFPKRTKAMTAAQAKKLARREERKLARLEGNSANPSEKKKRKQELKAIRQANKRSLNVTGQKSNQTIPVQQPSGTGNPQRDADIVELPRESFPFNTPTAQPVLGKPRELGSSYIKAEPLSPPTAFPAARDPNPRRIVVRADGRASMEVLPPRLNPESEECQLGPFHNQQPTDTPHDAQEHRQLMDAPKSQLPARRRNNAEVTSRDVPTAQVPASQRRTEPYAADIMLPPIRRRNDGYSTEVGRTSTMPHALSPHSPAHHLPLRLPANDLHSLRAQSELVEREAFHIRGAQPRAETTERAAIRHHSVHPFDSSQHHAYDMETGGIYISPGTNLRYSLLPVAPPPQRRFFVDEQGNEFVAIPTGSVVRDPVTPAAHYRAPYPENRYMVEQTEAIARSQPRAIGRNLGGRQYQEVIEIPDDEEITRRFPHRTQSYHAEAEDDRRPITFRRIRQQPEVIDMPADHDVVRRMPPPSTRLVASQRPLGVLHERLPESEIYQPQMRLSRAVSLQPALYSSAREDHRYVSSNSRDAFSIAPEGNSLRPYSTRPEPAPQGERYLRPAADGGWNIS